MLLIAQATEIMQQCRGSPSYLTAQDSDGMDFDGVDDYVANFRFKRRSA